MKRFFPAIATCLVIAACGGNRGADTGHGDGANDEPSMSAEDLAARPVLSVGELTTEVDENRYRSIAPPSSEFADTDGVIYFVGRLKNLPAEAEVAINWYLDAEPAPLLTSNDFASDKYQFIASFRPAEQKHIAGSYTVRVLVNGQEVGARSFAIKRTMESAGGPRISGISLSQKLTKNGAPKIANARFRSGADLIFVSFDIAGADFGTSVSVRWMRGEQALHQEEVEIKGDRRYSASLQSFGGLPDGTYTVEIDFPGSPTQRKDFVIGEASSGPRISKVAFGLELGRDNMPKSPQERFTRDTRKIHCGISFIDLPPNTEIEVQWTHLEPDGENLLYKNRSTLASGGSGTMGAAWEPGYTLVAGSYKAVILINGTVGAEQPFQVK